MNLHYPNFLKFVLWTIHLREIEPWDIGNHYKIIKEYPEIGGDRNFGIGNYGDCPDYRGDWNWWWRFLFQHNVYL